MTGRAPTLADIAHHAGISAAAVSLALRGSPRISAATRERVATIARRLGYRRDPLLAALARRRPRSAEAPVRAGIALCADRSLRDGAPLPWWLAGYRRGLRRAAKRLGYVLQPVDLAAPGPSLGKRLAERELVGLVLLPWHAVPAPDLADIDWQRYAAVAIGPGPPGLAIDRIHLDFQEVFREVVARIAGIGPLRIGYCNSWASEQQLQAAPAAAGQAQCLLTRGLHWCRPLLPTNADDLPGRLPAWLRRERPDLVVAHDAAILHHPELAGRALCCLHREPTDHDLAGFDRRPADRGALALEHLHDRIQRGIRGLPEHPVSIHVPGRWHDGPSLSLADRC